MSQTVRLGMIGVGGIAHWHMQRLSNVPEAQVVALADPNEENLRRLKERWNLPEDIPTFSDWQEMLDQVEMEAVEIASPHTLHYEQAMSALERGLHVLVEKPMVCRREHAVNLVKKVEETGLILGISYQRHFEPPFLYIKSRLEEGALGRITFISALQGQDWYRATKGTWRQVPELGGGGQITDSGSHLVDVILWMTGLQAQEVFAYQENFDAPVDINSALSIRFTNGALGNLSIVGDCPPWWEDITLVGTEGALFYRNGRLFEHYRGQKTREVPPEEFPAGSDPDRNFVEAILGKAEIGAPAICGLRVIELTEAAWESAKLSQPYAVIK